MDSRDDFALIVSVLYLLFKTKFNFLVKFDSKVLTGNINISTEMKCFCRNELSKSL